MVAVQLSVLGLYAPPVFKYRPISSPPQTIILLPVQTAVCAPRAAGALVVLVAVQLGAVGLYLPPVSKTSRQPSSLHPPQTIISLSFKGGPPLYPPQMIISLPAHTAV